MNFKIDKIGQDNKSDWMSVYNLDIVNIDYPWTKNQWLELSSSPLNYQLYGIRDMNDALVGFSLYLVSELEFAHLLKIAIKEIFRGKNIAQLLLDQNIATFSEQSIPQIYLEVSQENKRAKAFYVKNGFEVVNIKANYYSDGQTAEAMQLKIK